MSAAPGSRTRLGALLLRKGLVSPVELETALEAQRRRGGLLGEILVRAGLASRPAIEDALAEQSGGLVDAEAGFGSGLRSQIASRRPLRAMSTTRPMSAAPVRAITVTPAQRPLLEAVPARPEPVEDDAVVRPLRGELRSVPEPRDLSVELMQQLTRWQRLADELRDERDALLQRLTTAESARAEAQTLRRELQEAREELENARREPVAATAIEHVVFVREGTQYSIASRGGPPPEVGSIIELDGGRVSVVVKVGRSPLPGDDRPCAFSEPVF